MNQFKTFSAALLAAVALMALTGTASATTATSPAGTAYTGTFKMASTNLTMHGSFISISCSGSTMEGKIESHGASVTAEGKLSSFSMTGCNYPVTVKKTGTLVMHATGGGNGTITWTGAEWVMHTSVGECIFTTSGTDLGTFTGGAGAQLHIPSMPIPRTGGSFFCGSSMIWTGNYGFSSPASLVLD